MWWLYKNGRAGRCPIKNEICSMRRTCSGGNSVAENAQALRQYLYRVVDRSKAIKGITSVVAESDAESPNTGFDADRASDVGSLRAQLECFLDHQQKLIWSATFAESLRVCEDLLICSVGKPYF